MLTPEQRLRFEAWIHAVGPRAVAYARSLVRDPSRAEDVVQECLYRLLRRAADYDLERDGVKLLFKAISNLCINQATREKALLSLDSAGDPEEGPIPVPDAFALRPDQVAQYRELEDAIQRALQRLPPLQRAAVELRSLGMSKEEIGEALGVSATNAGVLVHRGRVALAEELRAWLEARHGEVV
jgi:RNA polymerase sigma-70 factor (ECF subfamily)